MFSATCKSQHFAEGYSVAVHENRAVRKKEYGTVLTSLSETDNYNSKAFPLEARVGELETLICVRFDGVLNSLMMFQIVYTVDSWTLTLRESVPICNKKFYGAINTYFIEIESSKLDFIDSYRNPSTMGMVCPRTSSTK